ncbi:phage tail protein [Escherichia coli]
MPVPWPTATPPAGWLKCDGRAFTKEQARRYPLVCLFRGPPPHRQQAG